MQTIQRKKVNFHEAMEMTTPVEFYDASLNYKIAWEVISCLFSMYFITMNENRLDFHPNPPLPHVNIYPPQKKIFILSHSLFLFGYHYNTKKLW